jgi:hypothetical protein
MATIDEQIEALRERIIQSNEPDARFEDSARLAINRIGRLYDLFFYGDPYPEENAIADFYATVGSPEIAPCIRAIVLHGPDEGCNGTRNWDLEPLLAQDPQFDRLELFTVERTQPGHYNTSIVGEIYDEDGVLGRLLARMPNLRLLTSPSAPGKNFFEVGAHPLEVLCVDPGYDTRGFIGNLARSELLSGLRVLDWGEYRQTEVDDLRSECTPLDEYRDLLAAPGMADVEFTWRDPACTPEEIRDLQALRPQQPIHVIHRQPA